jgi:hypothetical protein
MTQFNDFQDWVTGGAGEGEPALPLDEIQQAMEDDIASLGTLHTSLDDMPATASERPNGTFYDYSDLERYLSDGGLVIQNELEQNVPNPIVHILRTYDEDYDAYEYEVYIDEDTP